MLKIISRRKCVLGLLFILIFSISIFGQNNSLQTDLSSSLKKFSLIRLNGQKSLRKVDAGGLLKISTAEKEYDLNLTPNDLRSARYRAEDTSENGIRSLESGERITTFKGSVSGETDSRARITLDGAKIEGFFDAGGERFYIEPARKFSRFAGAEDVVVYKAQDLLKSENLVCDSEIGEKIESGKKFVGLQKPENAQSLKVLEIATEADFSFVAQMGGAAQANNEILSILNMVEGVYENELNLSIRVVFQHTWSTPDSYNASTKEILLASFQNYWNAHFPTAQYPRSSAHLFSGRLPGYGASYIGYVCLIPGQAYGFNGWINSAVANALLTSHEIGHTLGGHHVDGIQDCGSTIMISFLSDQTPMTFCGASRGEIGNFVATNGICLLQRPNAVNYNFDGDGKADIAIWRPSNGIWYITNSSNDSFSFAQFGQDGDKIVPADYDGDGKTDVAVYRGGAWYQLLSSNNSFKAVYFGAPTDVPVPADYDGDGKADIAVFRPSDGIWHRLFSGSGNSYSAFQFGADGDIPLPADYDGDGKAEINVFRPSNGVWYRQNSSNNLFFAVQFGQSTDKPLMGDFDGDGKADVAVYRPSGGSWFILNSANNAFSAISFGAPTDVPTPADYDGDGKTDVSVFRPSNGVWYRFNSSNNSFAATQFGDASDIPAAAFYIQ